MKKSIAIFFLSLYLLSATEAHQLLKLPIAFQHFSEHRKEDKDITFYQFIVLHYFSGNPRDADYDRDMQLPFKTSQECAVLSIPVTIPSAITFAVPLIEFEIHNDYILTNDHFSASAYLDAVFQPPRLNSHL